MGVLKVKDAAGNWVPVGVGIGSYQLIRSSAAPSGDMTITTAWQTVGNSLAANIPVMAGNVWRMTYSGIIVKDATPGIVRIGIASETDFMFSQRDINLAANAYTPITFTYTQNAPASVVGRKVMVISAAGGGTLTGSGVYPGIFTIESLGPPLMA